MILAPRPNTYYTISRLEEGNLGADPETYRAHGQRFAEVVNTVETNGDYEKWSFELIGVDHDKKLKFNQVDRIIKNKATGLYLTSEKQGVSIDPEEIDFGYFLSTLRKDNKTQIFRLESSPFDGKTFVIFRADHTYSERFLMHSEGTPSLDEYPEKRIIGKQQNKNRPAHLGMWRAQEAFCDPHPDQQYKIFHQKSGDPLLASYDGTLRTVRVAKGVPVDPIQFVPTVKDKKIFYIYHPDSDSVVDVKDRGDQYGALLTVRKREEGQLYQQWYIISSPDGRGCIFGNVANHRYLGLGPEQPGIDELIYFRDAVQKEQTAILDEFWVLKPST